MVAWLTKVKPALIGRGSVQWHPDRSWLENADREHGRAEFRGIVAREDPAGRLHVIVGDRLREAVPPPLWVTDPEQEVEQTGAKMAAVAGPLFQSASRVAFVDRNFDPGRGRFTAALAAFLNELSKQRRGSFPTVEYHTGDRTGERPPAVPPHTAEEFKRLCESKLAGMIPHGQRVRLIRWRFEDLHDRFVLTDRGGLQYGIGLDEGGGADARTVLVTRLSQGTASKKLAVFNNGSPARSPRRSPRGGDVTVIGTRPG